MNHSIVDFYGKKCVLFDTGGLGFDDQNGLMTSIWDRVKNLISKSHVVLLVLDGQEGVTPLDFEIAQFVAKWTKQDINNNVPKTVIPVINKITDDDSDWDCIGESYELGLGEPIKVCSITLKVFTSCLIQGIEELKLTISNHLKSCGDDLFTSMNVLYNKGVDFNTFLIERKKRVKFTYEKTLFSVNYI